LILGDGDLRNSLLEVCKHEGLVVFDVWNGAQPSFSEQVYFLGYIANPYPYLKRAQLYIMTSSWEGYPLSLIEALICSLPAISSDCHTGPAEILDPRSAGTKRSYPYYGECGVLMPLISATTDRVNLEMWRDETLTLIGNPTVRQKMAMASLRRSQDFSIDELNDRILRLMNEI
jgi:glycosyltransferase involved in cell wall biosynthesis